MLIITKQHKIELLEKNDINSRYFYCFLLIKSTDKEKVKKYKNYKISIKKA